MPVFGGWSPYRLRSWRYRSRLVFEPAHAYQKPLG